MPELTPKQCLFVNEYLIDKNASQAAIRAGYNQEEYGRQLLTKPHVRKAIDFELATEAERLGITRQRVLDEMARVGFLDPAKLLDDEGNVLPLHKMDEGTRAAIAGMDVETIFEGSGEDRCAVGHVKKIKIANKLTALEQLAKHLGLFEKDNEQRNQDIHIHTGMPEPDALPEEK